MPDQQDFPSIVSFLICYLLPHKFLTLILKMVLTDSIMCYKLIITGSQAELFIGHIYNPVLMTFFHYWVTFE